MNLFTAVLISKLLCTVTEKIPKFMLYKLKEEWIASQYLTGVEHTWIYPKDTG